MWAEYRCFISFNFILNFSLNIPTISVPKIKRNSKLYGTETICCPTNLIDQWTILYIYLKINIIMCV